MKLRFKGCRTEAGIIFSYILVSLLILFPLLPHFFERLAFASNGDVRLSLTILFSNLKHVAQGDLVNIFQLPILFPLSHTLTAGINLFGQTLLVLPFYLVHIRNIYFLYNFLTFFAYVAAGYCAYRFVREWIPEGWIAWVIGALYILMPYRVHNIPQLNLMFSFPIPLTLLFFSRFLKKGQNKDLIFFFIAWLTQFMFDLSVGIFLGIALAIYFLVQQFLFGFLKRRMWLLLGGGILFFASVALIFLPYLNPETSFSIISEIKSIPTFAFHSPISFYSNWSYVLLFFKGIVWHQSPFSPGITVFFFFMLAFVPYLENRFQKAIALFCLVFLSIPALAMPFIFKSLQFSTLNRALGWTLLLFLFALSILLYLLRKKIPRPLLLISITWIFLQFYSSQISLPFFNIFQGLANVLPILLRARFIRTEYILLLLFFTVAAFGFSYFYSRFREKKTLLALVLLLVFAERIRWPVVPEKLKDDRPGMRAAYLSIAHYPRHFGLLELPFDPLEANHYALFSIYHDKHTYHGHINYLKDFYQLEHDPRLRPKNKFSGLSDRRFTDMLKAKGIRLIMLFKNRGDSENQKAWHAMQRQVRLPAAKSLYEKIEKTEFGALLVLDEKETGPRVRYFLPHYSLRNRKNLVCTIRANKEWEAEFLFNDVLIGKKQLQVGTLNRIVIGLSHLALAKQSNYLEIRSGDSLELLKVRVE